MITDTEQLKNFSSLLVSLSASWRQEDLYSEVAVPRGLKFLGVSKYNLLHEQS